MNKLQLLYMLRDDSKRNGDHKRAKFHEEKIQSIETKQRRIAVKRLWDMGFNVVMD